MPLIEYYIATVARPSILQRGYLIQKPFTKIYRGTIKQNKVPNSSQNCEGI